MFDGNTLRGATVTPMRMIALREHLVGADAEPEPLTLAKRMTKSLTASIGMPVLRESFRDRTCSCPRRRSGSARRTARNAGRRLRPSPSRGRSSGRRRDRGLCLLVAGARRRCRRSSSSPFVGEGDAVHRADVDAGVALDAERCREHGLHVAVQAAPGFGKRQLRVEAELDLGLDVGERDLVLPMRHRVALVERHLVFVATTRGCPSSG